jgi:hypothetical protein
MATDIEVALGALLRALGDSLLAGRLLVVDTDGVVRAYSPSMGKHTRTA